MLIFQYCPECKKESVEELEKNPRVHKFDTDGFGQPVRFTDCRNCGGSRNGYFQLSWYDRDGNDNDNFLDYLKHRINFYYNNEKK